MKLTLSAPAKINLTLAITGLRSDGYHLLSSLMQTVSLSDTIEVETIPSGIRLWCNKSSIPTDEKNLCYKAAKRYLEASGTRGGVSLKLFKCIPDGAGLGGGSSDAACVLKAMSHLYPSSVDISEIAAGIGADVPFFLTGGTCLCEGIGEEVRPVLLPFKKKLFCVIAKPEESLSTPQIYSLFDQSGREFSPSYAPKLPLLEKGTPKDLFSLLRNDLELCATLLLPKICAYKEKLLSLGANASMMTGSGSAVFGLFSVEEKARKAAELLCTEGKESYFCTLL